MKNLIFILLLLVPLAKAATLKLKVSPAGSKISIANREDRELSAGYNLISFEDSVVVEISKNGYEPTTIKVKGKADETVVKWVELTPLVETRVFFDIAHGSCFSNVTCYLDGDKIIRNDLFFREKPRTHKIDLESSGYFSKSFSFRSGENQSFRTSMREIFSDFYIGFSAAVFRDPVTLKSGNRELKYDMTKAIPSFGFHMGYIRNLSFGPYVGGAIFYHGISQSNDDSAKKDSKTGAYYDGNPDLDSYGAEAILGVEPVRWLGLEVAYSYTQHNFERKYSNVTFKADYSTAEPKGRIVFKSKEDRGWRFAVAGSKELITLELGASFR